MSHLVLAILELANRMFSCRYIYYGFIPLLSSELPEISILEMKNGGI